VSFENVAAGAVERLAEAGLLTERQAEAFVLRDCLDLTRSEVADRMGVSVSAVDNHAAAAREKIEAANATVREVRAFGGPMPGEAE
jgi:DNA-directed RNA polymerase specialized sigma24 family protein